MKKLFSLQLKFTNSITFGEILVIHFKVYFKNFPCKSKRKNKMVINWILKSLIIETYFQLQKIYKSSTVFRFGIYFKRDCMHIIIRKFYKYFYCQKRLEFIKINLVCFGHIGMGHSNIFLMRSAISDQRLVSK